MTQSKEAKVFILCQSSCNDVGSFVRLSVVAAFSVFVKNLSLRYIQISSKPYRTI